jgi:hypothetical protein
MSPFPRFRMLWMILQRESLSLLKESWLWCVMMTVIGSIILFHAKDILLNENTSLKWGKHAKSNATAIAAKVGVYSGSGLPAHVHYRKQGKTEYHFSHSCLPTSLQFKLSLCGKVEYVGDRGYWCAKLLNYVLAMAMETDVFGTVVNQDWFPLTSKSHRSSVHFMNRKESTRALSNFSKSARWRWVFESIKWRSHLNNMNEDSWNYHVLLWHSLNIDLISSRAQMQKRIPLLLPKISRFIPLLISCWTCWRVNETWLQSF